MIYTLMCKECGHEDEYFMSVCEVSTPCAGCGAEQVRRECRVWAKDNITMHPNATGGGGSVQWEGYYDPQLGTEIRSKGQRKELMEQRGLVEHYHDPDVDRHIGEAQYIRSHSRKGDVEAHAEMDKSVKAAAKVQREKNIDAVFDRHPDL